MVYNPSKILINNHKKYFRDFAWRHNITPYRILIAEMMLNRTRAEQVEPVYIEFVKKYPTVKLLAGAHKRDINKFVKKLGLLWRAAHYSLAGKYILKHFDGRIPNTREKLLEIPGIGGYAAGAILAICFNKKDYVVDSNIARFITRYYGLRFKGEIRRNKLVIGHAKNLFNYGHPKKLLFALLDFTALICKPDMPLCNKCKLINCSLRTRIVILEK